MDEKLRSELIAQLKAEVHNDPDLTTMSDTALQGLISRVLENKIQWAGQHSPEAFKVLSALNFREKRSIETAVFEAIRGLGVLGQIITDSDITEVMINGYQDIFIEKNGQLRKLENHFESRQELETIITKFVSQAGRVVNESEPIVDTHLSDGSRVNVVMPPVALNGPIVTIRRFPKEAMTVRKLIEYGSITPEVAEFLACGILYDSHCQENSRSCKGLAGRVGPVCCGHRRTGQAGIGLRRIRHRCWTTEKRLKSGAV